MMSIFTARLEACDPARDCFRTYRLEVGTDLFGAWLVEATYGRIGSRGRTVRHVADDEAQARKIVRHCLQRRATAPRRIGVPYQLRELRDTAQCLESGTPPSGRPRAPGLANRSVAADGDGLRPPSARWCGSRTGDRHARPADYRAPFMPDRFSAR